MKLANINASCNLIAVLILLAATTAASVNDHYLLSCGALVTIKNTPSDFDGRTWQTDNNSTFSTSFGSTAAVYTTSTINIAKVPFSTARVFTANFTYSFPVSPGPKFIRLFFYPSPSPYSSSATATVPLSASDAYLTVQANSDYTLLRNFSAYLSLGPAEYFVQKEFYVNVNDSRLELTFSPSSPGSYAFVNGIEIVSVPNNLYVGGTSPKNVASPGMMFSLLPTTALETAYRVNVGGADLSWTEDTGSSMYRRWVVDEQYVVGNFYGITVMNIKETKIEYPAKVYQTSRSMGRDYTTEYKRKVNMTWGFEVDMGFNYLVRLHWCEVDVSVNSSNIRVFDVYIDQQMAEEEVDIFQWVGSYTACFRDYVVPMVTSDGSGGRGTLELAMHPDLQTDASAFDTILNGLEIFKISKPDNSLDAPNPSRPLPTTPTNQTPRPPQKSASHHIPAIIGAVVSAILLAVLSFLLIFRRRTWSKMSAGSSGNNSSKSKQLLSSAKLAGTTQRSSAGGSSAPSHLCRYFSLADIRNATSDFSGSLIIGRGGFGNVYKGIVNSETGPITVAIKCLKSLSRQGAREFTTEIELLSKLRHLHLVSLIGYCDEAGEMILVYEFMSHGPLRDHLYLSNTDHKTEIPWCRRLEICIGAAHGLHYLHTGKEQMIIHRDIKSTNILLDEKWMAKVSDFGLSKLGPTGADYSHVSTAVKGSVGYVDPQYYRRQQLTEKSDVYSFGVVLFEVLCAREVVNPTLPKVQVNLGIWARRNQVRGTLDTIVDPMLKGQIAPESLRKFGEVAESCVRDEGAQRPSMADVILGLEVAPPATVGGCSK